MVRRRAGPLSSRDRPLSRAPSGVLPVRTMRPRLHTACAIDLAQIAIIPRQQRIEASAAASSATARQHVDPPGHDGPRTIVHVRSHVQEE